jgi:tetratricopeptide (TPR) repeat protein
MISLLATLLGGCATSTPKAPPQPGQAPPLNLELFGPPAQIPDEAEIFELSDFQIQKLNAFLARFDDETERHWQLARFIHEHLSDFDYQGRTLTASQALQDQQGNCMSLAVITSAYTRHLGLDYDFQLMRTLPVFERQGDLVLVSDHVRTRVYPSNSESEEDSEKPTSRRAIIDYFPDRKRVPSSPVSNQDFLAMFYRNLAAERILDGKTNEAFWLAQRAKSISPDNASVLNLLAILHRRAGDETTAEALFRYGLEHHPDDINLLHNLYAMIESQERHGEARELLERLADLPDHNPYPRILLARQLTEEGFLYRARNIYESILDQMPYLHEAHWGLAVIHAQKGDDESARESLATALQYTRANRYERIYNAKLHALKLAH